MIPYVFCLLTVSQTLEKVDPSPVPKLEKTDVLPFPKVETGKIRWQNVTTLNRPTAERTPWEKDVSSRIPLGGRFSTHNTATLVHEATHLLCNRLTSEANKTAVYVGNGKGLVLNNPKGDILSARVHVPSELKNHNTYRLYMEQQPRNQPTLNRPLYPLEELCCYNNGAESLLQESKRTGQRSDSLVSPLQMAVYCTAIAYQQKKTNSKEWQASEQYRLVLAHEIQRAVVAYRANKTRKDYNWEDHTGNFFATSPKCEHLRELWKELGVEWQPVDTPKN